MDSDRTGIWGWSYGGFLSLSTLISDTTNTFKCGASVAPVTDWTLYDTYYTERYMGLLENNIDGYNRARVFNRLNNISMYNKTVSMKIRALCLFWLNCPEEKG